MNIENFRTYCLSKAGSEESFPFDEDTLVFKVCNKMFALTSLMSKPLQVSLKCEPEKAIALREKHDHITPAYHMNKTHWISIIVDGTLDKNFICELIDHSYKLVVDKLPKKQKSLLQ